MHMAQQQPAVSRTGEAKSAFSVHAAKSKAKALPLRERFERIAAIRRAYQTPPRGAAIRHSRSSPDFRRSPGAQDRHQAEPQTPACAGRLGRSHPELEGVYAAKRQDIEGLANAVGEDETVAEVRARIDGALDDLDGILRDRPYVAGSSYSLADVAWTVLVARCIMLGVAVLDGRPALERWYRAMKERPSFAIADVWERFRPQVLLKVMARRYGVRALIVGLLAGGLAWALITLV
jgi:hypothetical protein